MVIVAPYIVLTLPVKYYKKTLHIFVVLVDNYVNRFVQLKKKVSEINSIKERCFT